MAQPRKDLQGIQYLRGLAALMVVLYHLSGASLADNLMSGVDIFFVISGLIMVHSTGSSGTPGEFLRRRLVRIAPLYWAVTLFATTLLVLAPHLFRTARLSWPLVLASLAFVAHSNPASGADLMPLVLPGWTLNLEMMFYVLFAAGLWLRSKAVSGLLITTAPICVLAVAGMALHLSGMARFYTNPIILEFVIGMILGVLVLRTRGHAASAPVILLGALLVLALNLALPRPASEALRPLRYGLPAALLVGLLLSSKVPAIKPLHLLGDASYSLYLSQFFVISAFSQAWGRLVPASPATRGAFISVGVLVAVAGGIACWAWIERPLTSAANALSRQWLGRPARLTEPA